MLDDLVRKGIDPISPADGRQAFLGVMAPDGPATRLITGRFPDRATLQTRPLPNRPLRYLEDVLTATPDVQLVARASISPATDASLRDHQIDSVPVLPAVASLEAVAQGLSEIDSRWQQTDGYRFRELEFRRPLTTADSDTLSLQTSLTRRDEDHYAWSVGDGTGSIALRGTVARVPRSETQAELHEPFGDGSRRSDGAGDPAALYGSLFFHGRAFERLVELTAVGAGRLEAILRSDQEAHWYSAFLPAESRLGDLGYLDASIHVLQACYPARTLLPVSAAELQITPGPGGDGTAQALMTAVERPPVGDDLVFDVTVQGTHGVIDWRGLRLREYGDNQAGPTASALLLGSHLARSARSYCADLEVEIATDHDQLARDGIGHGPSGQLQPRSGNASRSHAGDLHALATASSPIGIDLVTITGAEPALASRDVATAAELNEPDAGFVVWAAREAVSKAGRDDAFMIDPAGAPGRRLLTAHGSILTHRVDDRLAALFIEAGVG